MTISNIKNGLPNNYHITKLNNYGLDEKGRKFKTSIKNICSCQMVPKTLKIHLLGLQLQYAKPNDATYSCVDGDDVAYDIL
jgi:hypothetical protein